MWSGSTWPHDAVHAWPIAIISLFRKMKMPVLAHQFDVSGLVETATWLPNCSNDHRERALLVSMSCNQVSDGMVRWFSCVMSDWKVIETGLDNVSNWSSGNGYGDFESIPLGWLLVIKSSNDWCIGRFVMKGVTNSELSCLSNISNEYSYWTRANGLPVIQWVVSPFSRHPTSITWIHHHCSRSCNLALN